MPHSKQNSPSEFGSLNDKQISDIESHLRKRGIDPDKIQVIIDKDNNIATFILYNLSGQLVGYQRYNPNGDKKDHTNSLAAKYFTYVTRESSTTPKLAVWGTENIQSNNPNLFITEGIFDAAKIHAAGHPVIAVLGNNPKILQSWLKSLNKHIIAILDSDDAGKKLAKLADESYTVPEGYKDLGDMTQEQANEFLSSIGYDPISKSSNKPMNKLEVRPVKTKEEMNVAKDQITKQHYIHRWPRAVQSVLGIFVDGKQVGTMLYGVGTRVQATREIFQNEDGTPVMQNNQMWELQRLFTTDESKSQIPNLASMVISRGNDLIRTQYKTKDGKPIKAILSFADSNAGHTGSIYKSTNATYLGVQRPIKFWIITNPKTGNYVRRSSINQSEYDKLKSAGLSVEKQTPESGKHKFLYVLGKDQSERDELLSKIVKPIFSYPKPDKPSVEIPNDAKLRIQNKSIQTKNSEPADVSVIIDKLMNSTVTNPETKNKILVKTALGYDKSHPSYKQARGMVDAWKRKYNINIP